MNHNGAVSWQNPNLEIRDTGRYGKGVFACHDISRGETLFVIGRRILTRDDELALPVGLVDKPIEITDWFSIGPKWIEDLEGMPYWYLNHGCDPNAGFQGQVVLVAMRPILHGEQIVFDYAMCLRPGEPFKLTCLCGSPNCRRVVAHEDWKLPELQQRYNGYFQ